MSYDDLCGCLERKILLISEVTFSEMETSININLIETNLKKIENIYLNFAAETEIPKIRNLY